ERARRLPEDRRSLLGWKLEVEDDHQVGPVRLRFVVVQVGDRPGDRDRMLGGELTALRYRDVREVDGANLPEQAREPDGVPALPAGEVERPPGPHAFDLLDQEPVGTDRPDELGPFVAAVPLLARHVVILTRSRSG